ncbi:hypothetical protein LX16_1137 [Stackebrandtia albiflava]|uniref:Cell division protein FtsB n=1 Tax=Stackebrandtia albiflava TaxID=406432 RepID=A0A562VC44_9ACTN|nr:hypothetical protein [Stackebrandtia albiflava]TWJ15432.1 hypothetical protein LX16_1137 [Stackebrandtia albiflava]
MTDANRRRRGARSPHIDTDEIIRSARRRARAADSRKRALLGDTSQPVSDGQLALQPVMEPEPAVAPAPAPPRRQTAPVRRPRKAVAPPEPVAVARAPFVVSILGLIAAGIVGLLVLTTAINENAFILQDLRDEQAALDASEQQLTDELADLSAPGNLAAAAERLGLVPAEEVTYLRLPDGKELAMPTPGGN